MLTITSTGNVHRELFHNQHLIFLIMDFAKSSVVVIMKEVNKKTYEAHK